MDNIRKAVDEFKKQNGDGIEYSLKELISAIHTKIDNLEQKINKNYVSSSELAKEIAKATSVSDKKIAVNKAILYIHTIVIIGIAIRLIII